jgi:hypothetical protein
MPHSFRPVIRAAKSARYAGSGMAPFDQSFD